ncbi:MAG: penicillin-insensitive murein endopeptidase [Proteobacteria bacterium]|nr:penicillin-insensitive murein endopeptidase [Pseudomonadota bacterium]
MHKSIHTTIIRQFCLTAVMLFLWGCKSGQTEVLVDSQRMSERSAEGVVEQSKRDGDAAEREEAMRRIWEAQQVMRNDPPVWSREFYRLPGEESLSFSIGDTRDGYMIHGLALPTPSLDLRQLSVQYERGLAYGTKELIDLLADTARFMSKRYPGTIMQLGNLGAREGGDIPYSISHNAGRDADIGFYLYDVRTKQPVLPSNLQKVNRRLLSDNGAYVFDVEKNAALVKALLTHPRVRVQFIFLARHLRTALWDELVAKGESQDILDRFEQSVQVHASHDDHFHVRIYCADHEICAGCIDRSVVHPWHEDFVPKQEQCVAKHRVTLGSSRASALEKAVALQRLAGIDAAAIDSRHVSRALTDDDPQLRRAAANVAPKVGKLSGALARQLEAETDDMTRLAIVGALSRVDDGQTVGAFRRWLEAIAQGGDVGDARVMAIMLGHILHAPRAEYLGTLVDLLAAESMVPFREALQSAVAVVTNHDLCVPAESAEGAACAARYRQWLAAHGKETRDQWVVRGMQAAGFPMTGLNHAAIPRLLDAIDGPKHVSVNAQLVLKRLGNLSQNSLEWSVDDARWHYTRYFKKRQKKYKIDLSDRDERGRKL